MKELNNEERVWIFDLDNTLYNEPRTFFAQISGRMTEYIVKFMGMEEEEASELKDRLFLEYGTSLSGLIEEYGIEPTEFLRYVRDIDYTLLSYNEELHGQLGRIKGRKYIYTNACGEHACRVLERLRIGKFFTDIYDIEKANYVPKPYEEGYRKMREYFGIELEGALMLDDIPWNLRVPYKLGMLTVLLEHPYTNNNKFRLGDKERSYISYRELKLTDFLGKVI